LGQVAGGVARHRRYRLRAGAADVRLGGAAGGHCRWARILGKGSLKLVQVHLLPVPIHQAPHLAGALVEGRDSHPLQLPTPLRSAAGRPKGPVGERDLHVLQLWGLPGGSCGAKVTIMTCWQEWQRMSAPKGLSAGINDPSGGAVERGGIFDT
jgi:hypothetical protein